MTDVHPIVWMLLFGVILIGSDKTASANKCGAHILYDLHLESIEPDAAPLSTADSGDWPTEWPSDASVRFFGYDTTLVVDDAHVLFTN